MESFFAFIFFMALGAGCFFAGYVAHGHITLFKKEIKKLQQPQVITRKTVNVNDAVPKWRTRVPMTKKSGYSMDVAGEVDYSGRTVRVKEHSEPASMSMFGCYSSVTIPAADVDAVILAMKSAQLAAMSGPEE